jgi:hypothetical protein
LLDDPVHDAPTLLDLVGANEQGRVADERFQQEPLIGFRGLLAERGTEGEVHRWLGDACFR